MRQMLACIYPLQEAFPGFVRDTFHTNSNDFHKNDSQNLFAVIVASTWSFKSIKYVYRNSVSEIKAARTLYLCEWYPHRCSVDTLSRSITRTESCFSTFIEYSLNIQYLLCLCSLHSLSTPF